MLGLFGLLGGAQYSFIWDTVAPTRRVLLSTGVGGGGDRDDFSVLTYPDRRANGRAQQRETGLFTAYFERGGVFRRGYGSGGVHDLNWLTGSGGNLEPEQANELTDFSDLLVNQLHDAHMEATLPAQPVSTRYLASLPRVRRENHWGDHCAICLEEFGKRDELLQLLCEHLFHEECVTKWLSKNRNCPTCRYEMPEQNEVERRELLLAERAEDEARCAQECAAAMAALGPGSPCALFDVLTGDFAAVTAEEDRVSSVDERDFHRHQRREVEATQHRSLGYTDALHFLQRLTVQVEREDLEFETRLRLEIERQQEHRAHENAYGYGAHSTVDGEEVDATLELLSSSDGQGLNEDERESIRAALDEYLISNVVVQGGEGSSNELGPLSTAFNHR